MQEYKSKILDKKNLNDLTLLYKEAFKKNIIDCKFKWKYFKNPSGEAILGGVFFNEKLVGSGALIPEDFLIFGEKIKAYKFTDLMTHPDHQRKGISKNVTEILNNEIKEKSNCFLYTLCSKVSTKSFVKNNWSHIGQVSNLFKPYIIIKFQYFTKLDMQVKHYYNLNDKLNNYLFNVETKIELKKSIKFLKWKFQNPDFKYHLICSYGSNNNVNGVLIYSIKNNILNIVEVDSINREIKNRLLKFSEYLVVKNKYKGILILAIKGTYFYDSIKKNGYLENPFNFGPLKTILDFNIYNFKKDVHNLNKLHFWNIKGINYDDI